MHAGLMFSSLFLFVCLFIYLFVCLFVWVFCFVFCFVLFFSSRETNPKQNIYRARSYTSSDSALQKKERLACNCSSEKFSELPDRMTYYCIASFWFSSKQAYSFDCLRVMKNNNNNNNNNKTNKNKTKQKTNKQTNTKTKTKLKQNKNKNKQT